MLEAGALSLKGKSSRTSVFAVVGDEHVAASAEFAELQAIHAQLVQTFRARSTNGRKLVNAAKLKATAVMDGLQEFYARITRRANQFVAEPAVEEVS